MLQSRRVNLIKLLLQVTVSLSIVLHLFFKILDMKLSVLQLDLTTAQLFLKFTIQSAQLFYFSVALVEHVCKIVLSYAHLSEDLSLASEFALSAMLIDGKAPLKLHLEIAFLTVKLRLHLCLKLFLSLHDAFVCQPFSIWIDFRNRLCFDVTSCEIG